MVNGQADHAAIGDAAQVKRIDPAITVRDPAVEFVPEDGEVISKRVDRVDIGDRRSRFVWRCDRGIDDIADRRCVSHAGQKGKLHVGRACEHQP